MADDEVEETLAAIDHDLDALYLLSPPGEIVGTLPKGIMRALYKWKHICSKVLISSVLAERPRRAIPRSFRFPPSDVLHPLIWSRTHYVASRSFPITQIIYQSTFNNCYVPHSRPILAHVFIGGGLVSPPRLYASILKTFNDIHLAQKWETLEFTRFLIHNLGLGQPTFDSDDLLEVRSIPMEASFALYNREPRGSIYSNPGYHMCDLTTDAWTAVVLRDEIPKDPTPQGGLIRRIDTGRFRIVLLRPNQTILVGESQSISAVPFQVLGLRLPSDRHPSAASQVLTSDRGRTVVQFQVGVHDVVDAISAVQTVVDAAAAARDLRARLQEPMSRMYSSPRVMPSSLNLTV